MNTKQYQIKGFKFITVKYFFSKGKRVNFLKSEATKMWNIIESDVKTKNAKIFLENRISALDAYIDAISWLIREKEHMNEKRLMFEQLYTTLDFFQKNIISYCIENWFDNKILKSDLGSFSDSAISLTMLIEQQKYIDSLKSQKDVLWREYNK